MFFFCLCACFCAYFVFIYDVSLFTYINVRVYFFVGFECYVVIVVLVAFDCRNSFTSYPK